MVFGEALIRLATVFHNVKFTGISQPPYLVLSAMKVVFWLGSVATTLSLGTSGFAVSSQKYVWKNAKIGGGGGFVPGIVFNAKEKVCTFSLTPRQ
jgi:hypothetical protein